TSGRVGWLGTVPDEHLREVYAACDVLVWPAVNEAFGMGIVEAQAAGLPVVAGRTGGVPEVVAHGITGLLTAPEDMVAFATAVREVIVAPERREAMGRAAAERARRLMDVATAAGVLDTTLRRVAGSG
ncbi:MAG: glycosyltransferase, partial [Alphaproteobacteria bacterium]